MSADYGLHKVGRARPALKIRRAKPRKRFRGVPAPPLFDLAKLADGQLLSQFETAAVTRRAQSTLESWRHFQPDHPLKWRRIAGRIMYEGRYVRAFLNDEK